MQPRPTPPPIDAIDWSLDRVRQRVELSVLEKSDMRGNLRRFAARAGVPYTWLHGLLRVRPVRAPHSTTVDVVRLLQVARALDVSLEALGGP